MDLLGRDHRRAQFLQRLQPVGVDVGDGDGGAGIEQMADGRGTDVARALYGDVDAVVGGSQPGLRQRRADPAEHALPLFWTGYAWISKVNMGKDDPAFVSELYVGVAMMERVARDVLPEFARAPEAVQA